MTTWCASYVGIKMMFSLFPMGLKVSLKLIFYMNNRHSSYKQFVLYFA